MSELTKQTNGRASPSRRAAVNECNVFPASAAWLRCRALPITIIHTGFKATIAIALWLTGTNPVSAQTTEMYEKPPISYSATQPDNAITRLQSRLLENRWVQGKSDREIVEILLRELNIPAASQLLVFSKTSLQRSLIDPRHPRAMFFNDDCYLGWCPGGLVEVAVMDPVLGPVFYAFNPREARTDAGPRFVRDQNCLSCHGGNFVRGIPSVFARSVPTDDTGDPLLRLGSEVIDYRTPFEDRWGGWYVTGRHGEARHQGNIFSQDDQGRLIADVEAGANVTDLKPFFDTSRYLTGTSDVVALMVFEHQIAMHNALTRAAFDARRMLHYQETLQRELGDPQTDEPSYDSVKRVFENRAVDVVDHLLFKDEANLPRGGVEGGEAFQKAFADGARRNAEGHSLKDLNLEKRLFENRCSYLIYSENFSNLPEPLKRMIYGKLARALHPTEPDDRYYYLRHSERRRIVSILRETLCDLPENWLREG